MNFIKFKNAKEKKLYYKAYKNYVKEAKKFGYTKKEDEYYLLAHFKAQREN